MDHGESKRFVERLAQRVDVRTQGIAVRAVIAPDSLLENFAWHDPRRGTHQTA